MPFGFVLEVAATEEENVGGAKGPPYLFEEQDKEDNDAQRLEEPHVPRNIPQVSVLTFEQHSAPATSYRLGASIVEKSPIRQQPGGR